MGLGRPEQPSDARRAEAEALARELLKRAATDPEPMLLVKAAEMLLQGRG